MLYDSVVYPVFLLATLAAYWLVRNPGGRKYVLCAASLLWLAYLNWRGAATFFMLSLLVYAGAQSIFRRQVDGRARTVILAITLALPISYLATFKYLPEYFVPIRQMLESLRADQTLLLPLGISYFTFRFISYVIEARRRALPPHGFEDFLCYVALFSTFPAGPIDRFAQIQPQLEPSTWQSSDLTCGLERILLGAAKKVLVADFLILSLQDRFGLPADISLASWRTQVGHLWIRFLYLYFDFSGYSDIAIGTSRLFGIRVMENFNWPLTRGNISDFWRSWHMSLSSWCRDYIYFPVFGLTRNPRLGVYASMLVLGYWHGAHPKWLLWGAWHATGLATWQWWQTFKRRYPSLMQVSRTSRTYRLAAIGVTLNFVVIGGVWTSFDSPLQSLLYIYYLFTP